MLPPLASCPEYMQAPGGGGFRGNEDSHQLCSSSMIEAGDGRYSGPMRVSCYLACLPLPCSTLRVSSCRACLPLACAALHASLCLALACVPSAALGCRACLLAQPEFFMPLTHSRTSSNLPRLLFFPPFPTPFLSCVAHSAWCVCLNVSLYLSCVCLSPLCLSCMGPSASHPAPGW